MAIALTNLDRHLAEQAENEAVHQNNPPTRSALASLAFADRMDRLAAGDRTPRGVTLYPSPHREVIGVQAPTRRAYLLDFRIKGRYMTATEAGVRPVNPMLTALNYGVLHVTIKVLCEMYLPKVIKINLHGIFFIR